MKYLLSSLIALTVGAVSIPANAQMWLKDRQATQGSGFRWGDIELHPGIGAEFGYDSNYFARPNNAAAYPIVDTMKLRFTPQLYISTLSPQRKDATASPPSITFSLGGTLMWSEFLTNRALLGRDREIGASADGNITFAPGRPWSFAINDRLTRTAQPSIGNDVTYGLDRWDNRASGELTYNRNGGLLTWGLGYAFANTSFSSSQAQQLDNYHHEIFTQGKWRFFPRTALIFRGSIWVQNWMTSSPGLPVSTPVRLLTGLSGLLTDRLAVTALVGWGAGFYRFDAKTDANAKDFDSIIGQLELRYFLSGAGGTEGGASASSSVAVGVSRDFQNGLMSYVAGVTKAYVSGSAMIAQRFYVGADVAYLYYENSEVLIQNTGTGGVAGQKAYDPFNNSRLDATLFAEYRITDWLGFNGTLQYSQVFADQIIDSSLIGGGTASPTSSLSLAYQRVSALVGVRAFF